MATEPLPPPAWTPADPAALRDALAEAKVSERLPGPSYFDYVTDVGRDLVERLFGALERAVPWAGLPIVERIAVYTAVGAALAALLAVLVAATRLWRRSRQRREAGAAATALPAAASAPSGDAGWWEAELRRRLEAGALRPALEAAWWWTARRLDPPGLDSSWTSGELLRRSGRAALRPPLRRLDRQLWGGGALERQQVESVVAELAGALP
jgi:hypothetical protein